MLPPANEHSLTIARRTWLEANADDFEQQGMHWRDRASGELFRRVPGNPIAGASPQDVSLFFEADGHLIFLAKSDATELSKSEHQRVAGGAAGSYAAFSTGATSGACGLRSARAADRDDERGG